MNEMSELADIYRERGLDKQLAKEVAKQLMEHDALGTHARDEIGITKELSARPLQAAFASAGMFAAGAAIPVTIALVSPTAWILWIVPVTAIVMLGVLRALAAQAGGASAVRGAMRVCFWGTLAMGLTAIVGKIFGISV